MSSRRAQVVARIRGTRPSRRLLAVLATMLLLSGTAALMTGATFTSTTPGDVRVGAENDYTPPTATVTVPDVVSGTTTVSVDARDARTFVTRVVVEKRPAGSATWTTLCTITSAPWNCSWNTATETDGDVSLRATATDSVGLTGTSPVVTTRVANAAAVTLTPLPEAIRGTYTLNATVTGAAGRTVSSVFAFRLAGSTGGWTTISGCSAVTGISPACAWNTGNLTNDYEVRVTSTLAGGQVVQDLDETTVDNTLPTASLTLPNPLSGTVVIAPTVADADSGVASVTIDYRLALGSWTTLCTREAAPYRCSLDTTTLVEGGTYEIRVTVRDVAGNIRQVSLTRTVSNITASVSITSPESGDFLRGVRTVEVAANAVSINSVTVQRRVKGTTTWTNVCTDSTAPYSCAWDTTPLNAGTYELRAVLSHGLSQTLNSAIVEVIVDNTPLQALDIQGTPGPGVRGKLDAGDRFTFTYSTVVDLGTVRAGWDGSPLQVGDLSMRDKKTSPAPAIAGYDWLDVPGLGQVAFTQDVIKGGKIVPNIPATLTAETVIVGGTPSTVITVTIGTIVNDALRTANTNGTMGWTPATTVRTPDGQACSAARTIESGPADVDM